VGPDLHPLLAHVGHYAHALRGCNIWSIVRRSVPGNAVFLCADLMVFGQLAQLVRALRSHRRGHRFESCAAH